MSQRSREINLHILHKTTAEKTIGRQFQSVAVAAKTMIYRADQSRFSPLYERKVFCWIIELPVGVDFKI
jgi:hypothetical protein